MKVKVPIYGTAPAKATYVEQGATVGAQIGVNLLMPDGTVGTLAQLQALFGAATTGGDTLNTTDDLDEGQWHLWFTERRAQDAVGGILADSANVTLSYVGGTSLTADLTDLADSNTGALLAITRDAKGRITGTRDATITGTAGRITVDDGDASDGPPTIDLATVTDAGGGTLQRTAFDVYGRKTGTSAATTTDLPEGSNLYFTDARAADAAPIQSIVQGSGVTVDTTDPANPVISATGGGGGTFPFFLSNESPSNISLSSSSELPFFLADGTASDIPLAA